MVEIHESADLVSIIGNSGEFEMSRDLFHAYLTKNRPTQDNFKHDFATLLARATVPESSAHKYKQDHWFEKELDDQIISIVEEHKINPQDYLTQCHTHNDRTQELWDYVTPKMLDTIARNGVMNRFNGSKSIDRYTYLEHASIGGGTFPFFHHPFMGGYVEDSQIQENAGERRKEQVLNANSRLSKIGLMLYVNRPNYVYSQDITELFDSGAWVEKLDQSRAKEQLAQIYSSGSEQDFDEVDYVRLVVSPTQYDEDMIALPKPMALEFIANEEVSYRTQEPSILSNFDLIAKDIRLTDTIGTENGQIYVELEKKANKHVLSEVEKSNFWFDNYHARVFK